MSEDDRRTMLDDGDYDSKKKGKVKVIVEVTDASWWRATIRTFLYELALSYAVQLGFVYFLYMFPLFAITLATGIEVGLGSVLMVTIGVTGNPLAILGLGILNGIDESQKSKSSNKILIEDGSYGWYVFKVVVAMVLSMVGAFLAGLTARGLWGGVLLPFSLLPNQSLMVPGSPYLVGFVVFLLLFFYYHAKIYLSIHTEDGYGALLKLGIAGWVFGIFTFMLWQTVPNLNYMFAATTAAWAFTGYSGWIMLLEAVSVALVLVLYFFLNKYLYSHANRSVDNEMIEAMYVQSKERANRSAKNW